MYAEAKTVSAGGAVRTGDRMAELRPELVSAVERIIRSGHYISLSHLRGVVQTIARRYPEFVVWAGEVRGGTKYVVTIWTDWMEEGDKQEETVVIDLPEGTVIS